MSDKFLERCNKICYCIEAINPYKVPNQGPCSVDDNFILSRGESCPAQGIIRKTPKTFFRTHKLVHDRGASCLYPKESTEYFFDVFRLLSGKWSQKWSTTAQLMNFCRKYLSDQKRAIFLCKKNERLPIDSEFPESNLYITEVFKDKKDLKVKYHVKYYTFNAEDPLISLLKQEEVENNDWIFVSPIIEA